MTIDKDIINKFQKIRQMFDNQPIRRLTSDLSGNTYIISDTFHDKYYEEKTK